MALWRTETLPVARSVAVSHLYGWEVELATSVPRELVGVLRTIPETVLEDCSRLRVAEAS